MLRLLLLELLVQLALALLLLLLRVRVLGAADTAIAKTVTSAAAVSFTKFYFALLLAC